MPDFLIDDVQLVRCYVYYDRPILFSCRDKKDQLWLTVLASETYSEKRFRRSTTWLLAPLSSQRLAQLEADELELRSVFTEAEGGTVSRATVWDAPDRESQIESVPVNELLDSELPLKGIYLTRDA